MNQRIAKLATEIGRTQKKLTELTAKLKDLERQKTELENAEYVAIIRELDMTPAELMVFLKRHTHGGAAAAAHTAQPPKTEREETTNDKK